uniref:SET domain-containing protein n=1 Tax=Rhizophora mucronata TaxID=61149 RepID=A0A2P2J688_RHIMU
MLPLVNYSRWLSFLKNRRSLNAQFTAFSFATVAPEKEKPTRPAPPPIRVAITESAGRGVFATRRIGAGDLIHTAKPVVAHPSLSSINTVCYFCLKKLNSTESQGHNVAFCSQGCEANAMVFYDVQRKAYWSGFDDYCQYKSFYMPLI